MNDEPKRLVDEDPDGAASALIRAALQDGPPPPLGAKNRVAVELGIAGVKVTPIRQRRIALWTLTSGIAAAAAAAIVIVLPQRSADRVSPEVIPVMPMATSTAPVPEIIHTAPPAPAATVLPPPMATALVRPIHSTVNKPLGSGATPNAASPGRKQIKRP